MGRRKRRKQITRKVARRLPTIFPCPYCGKQTLSISLKKEIQGDWVRAEAVCGECGFCAKIRVTPIQQAVDAYSKLIDLFESHSEKVEKLLLNKECLIEDALTSEYTAQEEVQEEGEGQD